MKNCKENTGKNNCRWKEEIIDINQRGVVGVKFDIRKNIDYNIVKR